MTTAVAAKNGHGSFDVEAATERAVSAAQEAEIARVEVSQINVETILVPIVGLNSLIVHRFSEKAKRQMLDAMQGKKKQKENKDPEAEYVAAMYRFEDGGYGFPAIAFKAATIGACRYYGKEITMTACKQFVFFSGEMAQGQQLVRIEGEPRMREDVVRVNRGGADLRYRPEFMPWSTTLTVTYVTAALTRDSVLSLIEGGGMGVGVGEWRPEKDGDFGTYAIDRTRKIGFVS